MFNLNKVLSIKLLGAMLLNSVVVPVAYCAGGYNKHYAFQKQKMRNNYGNKSKGALIGNKIKSKQKKLEIVTYESLTYRDIQQLKRWVFEYMGMDRRSKQRRRYEEMIRNNTSPWLLALEQEIAKSEPMTFKEYLEKCRQEEESQFLNRYMGLGRVFVQKAKSMKDLKAVQCVYGAVHYLLENMMRAGLNVAKIGQNFPDATLAVKKGFLTTCIFLIGFVGQFIDCQDTQIETEMDAVMACMNPYDQRYTFGGFFGATEYVPEDLADKPFDEENLDRYQEVAQESDGYVVGIGGCAKGKGLEPNLKFEKVSKYCRSNLPSGTPRKQFEAIAEKYDEVKSYLKKLNSLKSDYQDLCSTEDWTKRYIRLNRGDQVTNWKELKRVCEKKAELRKQFVEPEKGARKVILAVLRHLYALKCRSSYNNKQIISGYDMGMTINELIEKIEQGDIQYVMTTEHWVHNFGQDTRIGGLYTFVELANR